MRVCASCRVVLPCNLSDYYITESHRAAAGGRAAAYCIECVVP